MSSRTKRRPNRTASHRPAVRKRTFRHDDLTACDLFSGFGGLTSGIRKAGFTTIVAANHDEYKTRVHEANNEDTEHWIADLVDPESADYHDVRDLPRADFLVAGVSCTNHSVANSKKAYEQGLTLFDMEDPEYEARVTRSERDRATANCALHYAERYHPRIVLLECTTEIASWGPAIPGRPKVGDGSTYRWWLKQWGGIGYKHKILYLNSMFFGVPQSRNRWFGAFWDARMPAPDLEHRPLSWCSFCDKIIEAVWSWKTGIPATGKVYYGEQYNYRCPSCRHEVIPPMAPSLNALDLTNLGTRIGDKPVKTFKNGYTGPMAQSTMERAQRCLERFPDFPPVLIPAADLQDADHPWQPMAGQDPVAVAGSVIAAHKHNGDGQPIDRPMPTNTATHEKAILVTGNIMGAAGNTFERPGSNCRSRQFTDPLWTQTGTNETGLLSPPLAVAVDSYQGAPRGPHESLVTQGGSETMAVLSARVLPNRTNGTSRGTREAMETIVGGAGSGGLSLLTAAGLIKHNGGIEDAKYRSHPVSDPLGTVVGTATTQGMLFGGWYKQNGTTSSETAAHPFTDPFGTLTGRDTTGILTAWREALAGLTLDDCYFRMMFPHEVGRGCGFDVDFPGHQGEFIVWGSARDQVDGFGNAVSPQIGEWIGLRLRAVL